jgi:hypothetical protein
MSAVRKSASNVTPIRSAATPGRVWLSPAQVCERVPGMTVRHLQYLREKGQGPRYYKPTLKTVVYADDDIDAWVAASVVQPRSAS